MEKQEIHAPRRSSYNENTVDAFPPQYPPPYSNQIGPGPIMTQPMGYGQQQSSTTVVVNTIQQPSRPVPRNWSTGICGCFEDMGSCCAVYWCAPCYSCYLSDKMGESCCLPCCLPCGSYLIALRVKMRTENNIVGSICEDCCMACWCERCVMCQLSREHDFVERNPI